VAIINLGDIADVNKSYYSSKGKAIYSDFSTFAQGKAIAKSNAIGFVRDFSDLSHCSSGPLVASATSRSGRGGEITVCEYGIGNGNFALVFLDEVKKKDASLYARTSYHLFDISEKMIADAEKNLACHKNCSFTKFDAASELPSQPFDYCRINELLSDLPAEIYARKSNSVPTSNIFVQKFLSRIDEGRQIPFSFAAEKFLLALCRCGRRNFRVDVFDYGFYTADDIFPMPRAEWNSLVARKYGEQITVDLNFLQLSSALLSEGFSVKVERQKEYAQRELGMPLVLDDSGGSLDYVPKKKDDGVEEDDGFYRLHVQG